MPLISSLLGPEIFSKMSCLMTVCDTPESTNAKNSVVPDRTLTVGRDLNVGSPVDFVDLPNQLPEIALAGFSYVDAVAWAVNSAHTKLVKLFC